MSLDTDEKLDDATLEALLASDDEDAGGYLLQLDAPPLPLDAFTRILTELEPVVLADPRASPLPGHEDEASPPPPPPPELGKPHKASKPRTKRTPKPKTPVATVDCEADLFLPLQGGHAPCDPKQEARAHDAAAATRREKQLGALSAEQEAWRALDCARSAVLGVIAMLHRQGWRRHHFDKAPRPPHQHERKRASLEAAHALVEANKRQRARAERTAAPPLAGGAVGASARAE